MTIRDLRKAIEGADDNADVILRVVKIVEGRRTHAYMSAERAAIATSFGVSTIKDGKKTPVEFPPALIISTAIPD